ncbi:MAG: hypothetical protein AAFN94_12115 [Pseudomonadota bacterium]
MSLFGGVTVVLLGSSVYLFEPQRHKGIHALPVLGARFGETIERTARQSTPRVQVMLPNGKVTGLRDKNFCAAVRQETACIAVQSGPWTGALHARTVDPVYRGPRTVPVAVGCAFTAHHRLEVRRKGTPYTRDSSTSSAA